MFCVLRRLPVLVSPAAPPAYHETPPPALPCPDSGCHPRLPPLCPFFARLVLPLSRYLDYAQGYNLTNRMPVFVRAKQPVTLNDTMWLMRTRFTGTWFDERGDVGAGPFHAEYRARPLFWQSKGKKHVQPQQ